MNLDTNTHRLLQGEWGEGEGEGEGERERKREKERGGRREEGGGRREEGGGRREEGGGRRERIERKGEGRRGEWSHTSWLILSHTFSILQPLQSGSLAGKW